MHSSNNSTNGAITIDNDLARAEAEFKELSALDLSGKLEALKKYDYKQTKFTYLLKVVTSHFLTDYDNTISQTDFNEMASVLYHYLKLINSKLPTLSFNSERPDRETRMDLAFSYFYENYKDILLTYIRLYKNSNLVFANNISELLKQLDKSFLNSPMTLLPNNLPLPDGFVESKSNSHDGTRVTVKEIESKLSATPAQYDHINSSQESQLSASRKYIDPKKSPGIVIHEKVDDLSKQLQIDRVEEEIFSLKINITLLTAAIKKSREMRECDQQLVDSIPARLTRLKTEISSLDETYTHITLNYIAGGKIEKSPEMPDLMAEFKNVEKLYNSLKSKFNRSRQTKRQNPSLIFVTTPSPTSSSSTQDQAANEGPPAKKAKIESGLAVIQAIVTPLLPDVSSPNLNETFFNLEQEYGFYSASSQDNVQIPVTTSLPLGSQLPQSFFHPGGQNNEPFITPSSHSPMDVSVAANSQSATTPYQNENSHNLMFFDNTLGLNQSTLLDDRFLNTDDDLLGNFRR